MSLESGPVRGGPPTARTVFGWCVAGALGVLVVAVAAGLTYAVRVLLAQVAVALFIAVSLDPAVRWLVERRVRRSLAVTLILAGFAALLALLVWLGLPPLMSQASKLTLDFPGYLDNLRNRSSALRYVEARFNLQPKLDEFARTLLDRIERDALGFVRQFLGALLSALLVVVLTIYFMADLPRLRRAIVRPLPARHHERASHAVNVMVDKVGSYMIGNLAISVIAGVTSFLAMVALGVPFALPLAFLVAITDLIPEVGATLGAIVCLVVAIATIDLWPGVVLLLAFFIAYQQVENYLIVPYVLRGSVDMPPLAVLLAALVGASLMGLIGALMAIPIAAAVKALATPMMQARDAADGSPAPHADP